MLPRLVPHFDTAQPLDPHISLPPRNNEPSGVSLFWSESLSVHCKSNQTVLKHFLYRNGPRHCGSISPLCQYPFGISLETSLLENELERNARIHDIMDHPMCKLATIQLRAFPLHSAIRRALKKINFVFARKAF